jgi:antitoxin YefM
MTIIMVMTSLPLAEVKSKFSEMIDRVEDTHDRITVTRNGRPAAVIVSPEDLEALEDTLDLLSDPAAVAQLHESQRAHAAGDYVGADVLKAKYLRK